jgi:hypothetical protein
LLQNRTGATISPLQGESVSLSAEVLQWLDRGTCLLSLERVTDPENLYAATIERVVGAVSALPPAP